MFGGEAMTWFKVDDGFWSHPKTVGLTHEAVALWVRSGSYCGQHLTDGVVPRRILPMLQGSEEHANELIDAGLWLDHIDGYVFHDWLKYQPTRTKVEGERAKTAERVAAWRDKRKENEEEISPSLFKENPTRPDPTRPPYGVTNGVSNGVTPTVTKFDEFWNEYPRKVGKTAARKAFDKAQQSADADSIIEAVRKYASDPNREPSYTAHPTTWLNEGRWDDEPLPARSTDQSKSEQRLRRNVAAMSNWQPMERELEPLEMHYLQTQQRELEA
jgi:hypothetical protein